MRTLFMLTSVAMLIAGTAAAEPPGEIDTMTTAEVARHAARYEEGVARCYKKHAQPTGDVGIYVVIARTGKVVYSEIAAPRVTPQRKRPLDRCLRAELLTWQFPAKGSFTNATIPYHISAPKPPGPFPNT